MAESSDSDGEVAFESADEGDNDDVSGENAESKHKEVVLDSTPMQGHESTLSSTGKKSANDEDVDGLQIKESADESRTKEDAREIGKKEDGKKTDLNQSESRTAALDETADAKSTGDGDGSGMAEGGDDGEQKEPEGEEIVDRGAASEQKDKEEDAKAGGAPKNASAAPALGGGSWGWGGWGTSLLSSAAATVTKVSDNVGKGLTQVLENVETSLGVPKPEELTEMEKQEAEKAGKDKEQQTTQSTDGDQETTVESEKNESGNKEGEKKENTGASFGGFFSSGASVLTNAMGKTVTGGLDALEMLGRKTMDILQEGDPRLEKKRGMIIPKREKVNLSDVLRQAKKDAEDEAARRQEEEEHQKYNFSFLFDQYQGLAHLEALEMLSNQSETKVQSSISVVRDEILDELKTELVEVRDAFQLEDIDALDEDSESDQDFVNAVTELLFSLTVAATPDKLQRVQKQTREWLANYSIKQKKNDDDEDEEEAKDQTGVKEIHAKAMQTLAELTSRTIEQFHKVGELMLLNQEKDQAKTTSPVEKATTLSKLASILSAEISSIATKFCELLSSMDKGSEEVNTIITNIYLEASNSTSYIQDAFQLLLPILQDIVVTTRTSSETS